jgi:hypothetical protein
MALGHRIDLSSGRMIEPVIIEDGASAPQDVILTRCPDGFHAPAWDATAAAWYDAEANTDAELAAEAVARLVTYTKTEAGRRILARLPDWKQRNLTARSAELLRIRQDVGSWTVEEQAEADAVQAEWEWVKRVRAFSDQLEADVQAGLITTTADIDAAAWP